MKRLVLILISIASAVQAQAQPENFQSIAFGARPAGKRADGTEITASTYTSKWRMFDVHADTTANTALILNRENRSGSTDKWAGMGNTIAVDLDNGRVLWARSVDYRLNELVLLGNLLVQTRHVDRESYGIDLRTGTVPWSGKTAFYYVDSLMRKGVGYRFRRKDNTLYGVDLNTGRTQWERELPRQSGWNGAVRSGNTLIVASGGLHTVDLTDGTGWDHEISTAVDGYLGNTVLWPGESMRTSLISSNSDQGSMPKYAFAGNDAFSLWVHFGQVDHFIKETSKFRSLTHGMSSNILTDGGMAWFAGRDAIICVDLATGRLVWRRELNSGASDIYLRGDTLSIVGKGYGLRNLARVNYGTSFHAGFDARTGEVRFNHNWGSAMGVIDRTAYSGDYLAVVVGSTVEYVRGGSATPEFVQRNVMDYTWAAEFVDAGTLYTYDGARYVALSADSPVLYSSTEGAVFVSGGEVVRLGISEVWHQMFTYGGYRFLYSPSGTVVADSDGRSAATLDLTPRAKIVGDNIFDIDDYTVLRIDAGKLVR